MADKVNIRASADLPDYERPPVIEVAFGVQFQGNIEGFSLTHAGRFWATLDGGFSSAQDAAPIQHAVERAEGTVRTLPVDSSDLPPSRRVQLLNLDEGWIVQIQPDRFLVNWRADSSDNKYPRFEACFARFQEYLKKFEHFCTDVGFQLPPPNQYELTYVNHILEPDGYHSLEDIGTLFPDIAWRKDREFLPVPKAFSFTTVFDLPDKLGRLHASIKSARRKSDNSELFLLDLTARGFPRDSNAQSQESWFLLAREWIVSGFADLANIDVQKRSWGRKA